MTYDYKRISKIKCFLFDMDGTINLGNELISGMEGFFEELSVADRKYYMLTNNSSANHEHYVNKMNALGVPITCEEVIISSDALTCWMCKNKPNARFFVLGTPQLVETVHKAGFSITNSLEEETDYVVIGFDQTLTYERLTIACRLIQKGVPYVATHSDLRCPIQNGEFIPDAGSILSLIKAVTGKEPEMIFGKPYKYMVDVVLAKTGFAKNEIAVVGDRLSTDIAFGLNNDILSILVLTGEASLKDVETGNIKPDIVLNSAKEILNYLD